jgi:tripartite-type tricarboxylate transporter receptor subunit TctC
MGVPASAGAQSAKMTSNAAFAGDTSVAEFYRGNTVYMVIGSAAGGGFDTYARIVSRYMAKYLPGNPNFVPQNLPGTGGIAAGTRVAVNAPQDGTFVGAVHPTTIIAPVLGDKASRTKPINFAFLGSASTNLEACFLRTDAPAKSFEDGFTTEMVLGASNMGSSSREYAALLTNILGMKIKIVGGYTGTADTLLAMERGEVQGMCGVNLANTVATRPKWFSENIVRVLSYQGNKIIDVKEAKNARPTVTYAKTEEQRQVFTLYDLQGPIGRPYVTGGDVPKERIVALQAAFWGSMQDPDFQREIAAKGLELGPISGAELSDIVAHIYSMSPEIVNKTLAALGYD